MKTTNTLSMIAIMAFSLLSCQKTNSDAVSATPIVTSSTGGTGLGTGGTGGTGGGGTTSGGTTSGRFTADFKFKVSDPLNILEKQLVEMEPLGTGISRYEWKITNGMTLVKPAAKFAIDDHGIYKIALTVTSPTGQTDRVEKEFYVVCVFGGGVYGNGTSH